MKKILLSIIIILGLSMAPFYKKNVSASYEHFSDTKISKKDMESVLKNEKSVKNAEEIINKVTFNEEIYSGLFIDNNDELVFGIKVEDDLRTRTNYVQTNMDLETISLDNYPKIIYFKYTLVELFEVQNKILDYEDEDIVGSYLKQSENKIIIRSSSYETFKNLVEFLKIELKSFKEDMVSYEFGQSIISNEKKTIESGKPINYMIQKNFLGIKYLENQWRGTVGFNAKEINSGKFGVVTNQHVAPLGYTMYDENKNYIGKSVKSEFSARLDASFIPFENQDEWLPSNVTHSTDQFNLKYVNDGFEGAKVWQIGSTSGSLYGTIISTSATVKVGNITHFDLIYHNCDTDSGDSGGPLISWTSRIKNQTLYGIHSIGAGVNAYAFKASKICSEFGLELA